MDANAFVNYVKNTPMLTEDRKAYYISKAADYSPELRQKLIEIIQRHEQEVIALGEERKIKQKQREKEEMHQRMLEVEKIHAKEAAQAERQLDQDLEKVFT